MTVMSRTVTSNVQHMFSKIIFLGKKVSLNYTEFYLLLLVSEICFFRPGTGVKNLKVNSKK